MALALHHWRLERSLEPHGLGVGLLSLPITRDQQPSKAALQAPIATNSSPSHAGADSESSSIQHENRCFWEEVGLLEPGC